MREQPRTYLGVELAGAKNQKTALAALRFFPREKKTFLVDIYDKIAAHDKQSGDQALLEILDEMQEDVAKLAVNVPLELPPCITCDRKGCHKGNECSLPAVKWMRELTLRASKDKALKAKEFTPYTQRPVELWIRYRVLPTLPPAAQFEIDEALGGNKAPLTARMHFLKKHLGNFELIEAWPKLTASLLSLELGLEKRIISSYRSLNEGSHSRMEFLETLSDEHGIFIYERDLRKLSQSLAAFDAFLCAYTGLLMDLGQCEKIPTGFPRATGWVAFPRTEMEA